MSTSDGRMTIAIFFAICFVLYGNSLSTASRDSAVPTDIYKPTEEIYHAEKMLNRPTHSGEAVLEILSVRKTVSSSELSAHLSALRNTSYVVPFGARSIGVFSMSAPSITGEHQLVNTYLEGYYPYTVENPMIPLYVLAQRKQYQLDAQQYSGREEVWQTSREAFAFTRGDCEDHALILADWLIAMGEDARVVLGDYRGGGHAWVVMIKDGKEFLLEATKKSGLSRTKPYPLAVLHSDYHPRVMFNRYDFWENTGSKYTTRYRGTHWRKQSRYYPYS